MLRITRWGIILTALILLVFCAQVMGITERETIINPIEDPGGDPIDPVVTSQSTYDVFFDLGDGTAFINGSTTDPSLQIGIVDLKLSVSDPTALSAITEIKFTLQYDPTKVEIITSYLEPSFGWDTSENGFSEYKVGTNMYVLEFDNDSKSLTTDFTTIAHIEIKPLCQNELSENSIDPVFGEGNTYIKNQEGIYEVKYYPVDDGDEDLSNDRLTPGTLTTAEYYSIFTISDDSYSGQTGDEVWLGITGSVNSLTYATVLMLNYNPEMVEYLDYSDPVAEWAINESFTGPFAPGKHKFMFYTAGVYMPEIENTEILLVKFRLKCDIVNTSALFSFDNTETINELFTDYFCPSFDEVEDFTDEGTITLQTNSALKAVYSTIGQPAVGSNDQGAIITFDIQSKGTFEMGMNTSTSQPMRINIDHTPYLLVAGDAGDVNFHSECDDGLYVNLEQRWNNELDAINSWTASEIFETKHTLSFMWNPTGYVPNWDNRYIQPTFINDYLESSGNTQMPDNQDCYITNSDNGYLEMSEFEPVEVKMAQFYATDVQGLDNVGCFSQSIKIRNNFDVGSFEFYVTFTHIRFPVITSYGENLANVECEKLSPTVYRFYSTELFAGFPESENLTKIGYFTFECTEYEFKPTIATAHIGSYSVTDANGDPQFATHRNGTVTLDCDPFVNCTVIFGDEADPPIEKQFDESNLPKVFSLHQNYPNPFNPVTSISLDLPKSSTWNITIYNVNGQVVKEFNGKSEAGTVSVDWDASAVSSGVYFYRVSAGDFTDKKKMILLK